MGGEQGSRVSGQEATVSWDTVTDGRGWSREVLWGGGEAQVSSVDRDQVLELDTPGS